MASKPKLPGYDYEFVEEVPQDYICSICELTMRNPVQTKCGHKFCKDCLDEALTRKQVCPLDNTQLTLQQVFKDSAAERQILSLKIKCSNHCDWQGELRDYETHITECPLSTVTCSYVTLGCKFKGPRKSSSDHYKNEVVEHVSLTKNEILTLQGEYEKQVAQVKKQFVITIVQALFLFSFLLVFLAFRAQFYTMNTELDKSIKAQVAGLKTEFMTLLHKEKKEIVELKVKNDEDRMQVKTLQERNKNLEKQVLDFYTELDKSKAQVAELKTELMTLLHKEKKEIVELKVKNDEDRMQVKTLQERNKNLEKYVLEIKENNTLMTKDDQSHYSYTWKINDFSKQLQLAKQQNRNIGLSSEPFYTERYGYKLRLRYLFYGYDDGKGSHVSIYMFIMRGEYDAILTWPFSWKFKFTLLDQKPDHSMRKNIDPGNIYPDTIKSSDAFQRPTKDENEEGHGYPELVSYETLQTENYVVDGVVFIKFETEKI